MNSPFQPDSSARDTQLPSAPLSIPNSTNQRSRVPIRLMISAITPSSPFWDDRLAPKAPRLDIEAIVASASGARRNRDLHLLARYGRPGRPLERRDGQRDR